MVKFLVFPFFRRRPTAGSGQDPRHASSGSRRGGSIVTPHTHISLEVPGIGIAHLANGPPSHHAQHGTNVAPLAVLHGNSSKGHSAPGGQNDNYGRRDANNIFLQRLRTRQQSLTSALNSIRQEGDNGTAGAQQGEAVRRASSAHENTGRIRIDNQEDNTADGHIALGNRYIPSALDR